MLSDVINSRSTLTIRKDSLQPIELIDAELLYCPKLPSPILDALFVRLLEQTPWQQEQLTLFGKTHPQPRLEAWYGDPGAHYTYSGIDHQPLPWTEDLLVLRNAMGGLQDMSFNSVLLNFYRDGNDAMGLHADDEPELGANPVIASLSLGEERRMYFRHKRRRDIPTFSLDLASGSLLIMRGETQANWKHGIRKTKRACGPRINLTFRNIISSYLT